MATAVETGTDVLNMTIKDWLDSLGKRKGMNKFRDILIGSNGEFEENQTLLDVARCDRDKVDSWFEGVKGVSGLYSDLIKELQPHWNELLIKEDSSSKDKLNGKIMFFCNVAKYRRDEWLWCALTKSEIDTNKNFKNKKSFKELESNIIRNFYQIAPKSPFQEIVCQDETFAIINLDSIELGQKYHITFRYSSNLDPWSHFHHTKDISNLSSASSIAGSLESGPSNDSSNKKNINNKNNTQNNNKKDETKDEKIDGFSISDFIGIVYLCRAYNIEYKSLKLREKLLNEIKQNEGISFIDENELRKKFEEKNNACLITGDEDNVVMAHICPKKVSSFKKALYLFRDREVWNSSKKFITPHDLRNVLPLSDRLEKEFNSLLFSFIYDEIACKWSMYAPIDVYETVEVKAYKIWQKIENNSKERDEFEDRITKYIEGNDIFRRCLFGHLLSMMKRHGLDENLVQQMCPSFTGNSNDTTNYNSFDNSIDNCFDNSFDDE